VHILLTDRLACPRCGPQFGLVLLADRIEARRVLEGRLGCSNCREQYLIAGGAADLRTGPTAADAPADLGDAPEAAVRIAALLGLAGAAGHVLIAGPGAELAPVVAALVPELEVLAVTSRLPAGGPLAEEMPGVSRLSAGAMLPLQGGTMRGVALTGGTSAPALAEALRVLVPGSRLVVDPAPPGTGDALRGAGAEVLLDQDGVVVAAAPGPSR
jgi:uncharacterized protein YbaR (Trm112 family)